MLKVWSPYANYDNIDLLNESMKLPFPNGKECIIQKSLSDVEEIMALYKDLFYFTKNGKVTFNKQLSTLERLKLLKKVLESHISSDGSLLLLEPGTSINHLNIENINDSNIHLYFEGIKQILDKHNLYLNTQSDRRITSIVNNYVMYNVYSIGADPVNLLLALTPIDEATGPIKKIGNKSKDATLSLTRSPGNVFNKFEAIRENLVGKDGISICAVGLKGFFGLTLYYNDLLNNADKDALERILLGPDHKGIRIGDRIYKTLINIRATDPISIKNTEVLKALAETDNDTDGAIVLSALLSLSTDFQY